MDSNVHYLHGFYEDEGGWRWMGPAGYLLLQAAATPCLLKLELICGRAQNYGEFPFQVVMRAGRRRRKILIEQAERPVLVEMAFKKSPQDLIVTLESGQVYVPAEVGINSDHRKLSVRIAKIETAAPCQLGLWRRMERLTKRLFSFSSNGITPAEAPAASEGAVEQLWGDSAAARLADEESQQIYWDSHPEIKAYLSRRISGEAQVPMLEYVRRRFTPSAYAQGLSLGCGWGGYEREALRLGIVDRLDAYDIAPRAVQLAQQEADRLGYQERVRYICADLNEARLEPDKYGICFAMAVLHHIGNLEHLLGELRRSLRRDGLLVVFEYVGPNRFQWEEKVNRIMNLMLACLPPEKRAFGDGVTLKDHIRPPLASQVAELDPSEAVRSADLLPLLEANFEVLERVDLGGTLLQFLLADIGGRFKTGNADDVSLLRMMILLEELLIDERVLPTNFVFMILRNSRL